MNDGFVVDTPEGLEMFHLLQIKYALRIEVRTGLKHSRGSVMNLANEVLKRNGRTKLYRTKAKVLEEIDALIAEKEEAMRRG